MAQTQAVKTHSSKMQHRVMMIIIYVLLIVVAFLMLIPFVWMLSASFKLNKDVFVFPIQWIPTNPRWQNYVDIWTRIPLLTFVLNTAKLTVIVTLLQLFTSNSEIARLPRCSSAAKTPCSWATLPPSRCPGRPTWSRSS